MEIEQIYTQLLSNPHTAIAVCSAESGEGVTSLAFALAQRNLLAGHSTLLVDLNLFRPAIKNLLPIESMPSFEQPQNKRNKELSTTSILTAPQLVYCLDEGIENNIDSTIVLNGVTAPTKRECIMKLRQPGVLETCISDWLQQYDTVIIDTSPLNRINAQNIPPERVAAACDGAILTVLAGTTTEAAVNCALTKLHNANALLLGSVFNDRDNLSLKEELLIQLHRLEPLCSWLIRPLKKLINRSRLLALEV